MRIDGIWHPCDDGTLRPVMLAEIRNKAGAWFPIRMLLDSGADRTVLSADVLHELGFQPVSVMQTLGGIGGEVQSVLITTQIRLLREDGTTVLFDGQFAAIPDPVALDMSVLGRDLTNLFVVIVDRPQSVVCLLGARHRYVIIAD